jgi:hypothetical protein
MAVGGFCRFGCEVRGIPSFLAIDARCIAATQGIVTDDERRNSLVFFILFQTAPVPVFPRN